MNRPEPILLFDGHCNLCSGIVQFILRHDQKARIKLTSLQSTEAQSLLANFNQTKQLPDSMVFIRGDKAWTESSAALELAYELGGIWKAAMVLRIFPAPFLDLCYRIIARNRYRIWGKSQKCFLPDPRWEKHFLRPQEKIRNDLN